jgi:hypothetical protein
MERDYHVNELRFKGMWKHKPNSGEYPAPHGVKQAHILSYKEKYNINVLVETGTFLGIMVDAMKNKFQRVVSIEIADGLYKRAKKMFENNLNVEIRLGDSGVVLEDVLKTLNEPAIFWLDGHYSGSVTGMADIETPIMAELKHIFLHSVQDHVILIDDARLFNGTRDYPELDELEQEVRKYWKNCYFKVDNDAIVILKNHH